MARIKWVLWGSLLVVTAIWLLADQSIFKADTFMRLRGGMVQYFGLLGIAVMSLCMILALRPNWLENRLNGLDKMYRLHKWLGISALVISITHFLWAMGPKYLSRWGIIEGRKPGAGGGQRTPPEGIEGVLRGLKGNAEFVGEWAFYLAVILMILALVKRFNYRRFFQTHMILAATYLAFVFHSVVLVKFAYWQTPVGVLIAILMVYGSYAAIMILLGRMGRQAQVVGELVSFKHLPDNQIAVGEIKVPHWPGHKAGQFAFVRADKSEGPHPYTIASAWDASRGTLRFAVKALGDYTSKLPEIRKVGQLMRVEGPYGRFTFEDTQPTQIWIGAGIGITPFLARLEELAAKPNPAQQAHLFHPTPKLNAEQEEQLRALCQRANVTLHLWYSAEHGRLNATKIMALVTDWQNASIWFCGPNDFGQSIHKDLTKSGLPKGRFHQEMFEMR